MKKSKLLLIVILLFLILLCFIIYLLTRATPVENIDGKMLNTITPVSEANKGEEKDLTLNFKSTQIIISLYPYANKNTGDYKYRLYDLVYLGSVNTDAQFPGKYITPQEDWTGSYIASLETNTIYMAMSEQIWHKMELVSLADLNSTDCSKSIINLMDGYNADSFNCSDSSSFCYLPIDATQGIVYSVYPGSIETLELCTIAKQNSLSGISLKSY